MNRRNRSYFPPRMQVLNDMWRFANNKKLRKKLNKATLLRVAMTLDREMQKNWEYMCGTLMPTCPLRFESQDESKDWLCLSYSNIGSKRSRVLVGCDIMSYCLLGRENFKKQEAWKLRVWRLRNARRPEEERKD